MHIRVPPLPSWRGEPRRGKLRRGQRRWITAVAVFGLTATSALTAASAYILYNGPGALERIASRLVPPSSGDESYQTEQPTPRMVAATVAAPAPEIAVATAAEPDVPEIGVPQAEITALQAEVPRVDGPPPSALLVASLAPAAPADPAAGPSATPGERAAAAPAAPAPAPIGPAMVGPQVGGGEFVRSGGGGEATLGSSPPLPGFAALPTGGSPFPTTTLVSTPAAPQSIVAPVTPPSSPPIVQQPAPAPVVQQAAPAPVVVPPPPPSTQPVVNNPGSATTPTSTSPAPVTNPPVVSGAAPGTTPSNPILPREQVGGSFVLPLTSCLSGCTGQDWRYFDPPVAVGFRYQMDGTSPNGIAKIKVPNFGDGSYDLYLFDKTAGKWTDTTLDIVHDTEFDLIAAVQHLTAQQIADYGIDLAKVIAHGLYAFEILGIEPDANIDPEHPHNFISGLLFAGPVSGDLILTPLTIDTDLQNQDPTNPTAGQGVAVDVPEPSSLALMLIGAIGLRAVRGRVRRR
jgi:hypothetical protein